MIEMDTKDEKEEKERGGRRKLNDQGMQRK